MLDLRATTTKKGAESEIFAAFANQRPSSGGGGGSYSKRVGHGASSMVRYKEKMKEVAY